MDPPVAYLGQAVSLPLRALEEHHGGVPAVRPLPESGSIFLDARGGGRALRVSWHHESGLVVLSLWRENVCAGSFRLAVDEVPDLISLLRSGLDHAYDAAHARPDPEARPHPESA